MKSNFEMINFPNEFYSDELGNLSPTPNYAQDPIVPKRNQVFGTIENIGKTWKVSFDILPTGEDRNTAWTSVFRISQKESGSKLEPPINLLLISFVSKLRWAIERIMFQNVVIDFLLFSWIPIALTNSRFQLAPMPVWILIGKHLLFLLANGQT